jgi:hypothetical protein
VDWMGRKRGREMDIKVLVFYTDNILVNKNTLCKCYFLTGILVQFRVFK